MIRTQFRLNFILPGFSKCGTTTLCDLLSEHPELHFASEKEPNFFNQTPDKQNWRAYCSLFKGAYEGSLLGEGSTNYSSAPFEKIARDSLLEHNPNLKFIFIVRDPIARIESSFRQHHHTGVHWGIDCPFDLFAALQQYEDLVADTCYLERLNFYREKISDDQYLVVFNEELKSAPDKLLSRCFDFLGVDSSIKIGHTNRRLNSSSIKYMDTPELRKLRNEKSIDAPGINLSKLPQAMQDQLLIPFGYRVPVTNNTIYWHKDVINWLLDKITKDNLALLKEFNQSVDIWPRFNAVLNGEIN